MCSRYTFLTGTGIIRCCSFTRSSRGELYAIAEGYMTYVPRTTQLVYDIIYTTHVYFIDTSYTQTLIAGVFERNKINIRKTHNGHVTQFIHRTIYELSGNSPPTLRLVYAYTHSRYTRDYVRNTPHTRVEPYVYSKFLQSYIMLAIVQVCAMYKGYLLYGYDIMYKTPHDPSGSSEKNNENVPVVRDLRKAFKTQNACRFIVYNMSDAKVHCSAASIIIRIVPLCSCQVPIYNIVFRKAYPGI